MANKGVEGPTIPTGEQLPAVVELANRVFRSDGSGDMGREYAPLFRPDALKQMRIMLHDGRPVSLVGVVISDVLMLGCTVRIAAIGAVCTDRDFRGQGLAGRLLDDAIAYARGRGASLMLISGGRGLYERRGAFGCGGFACCELSPEAIAPTSGLSIEQIDPSDDGKIATALRLFEAEPIRYLRDADDYRMQLATDNVGNRPGKTFLVRAGGMPKAVLSASFPNARNREPDALLVKELAGSRPAVLAAVRQLAMEHGAGRVRIDAYTHDLTLADLTSHAGGKCRGSGLGGTVKLLDFKRLWESFGPLLATRTTPDAIAAVRVASGGDDLAVNWIEFGSGDCRVRFDRPCDVISALFDPPDLSPLKSHAGPLADVLHCALPLPLPMYGLNYV